MRHAELVLVVEGEEDKTALRGLLLEYSPRLADAINAGRLAFETLGGGQNLAYVIGLLRDALLCSFHCFLDDDECGRTSYEKAKTEGLMDVADANFASVAGMKDAEIEDLYDLPFYRDLIWNQYFVQSTQARIISREIPHWVCPLQVRTPCSIVRSSIRPGLFRSCS